LDIRNSEEVSDIKKKNLISDIQNNCQISENIICGYPK